MTTKYPHTTVRLARKDVPEIDGKPQYLENWPARKMTPGIICHKQWTETGAENPKPDNKSPWRLTHVGSGLWITNVNSLKEGKLRAERMSQLFDFTKTKEEFTEAMKDSDFNRAMHEAAYGRIDIVEKVYCEHIESKGGTKE